MIENPIVQFSASYPAELSATLAPLNVELWTAMGFAVPEDYPPNYEAAQKQMKATKKNQKCDGWKLRIEPKARHKQISFAAFRIEANGYLFVNHEPDDTWSVSLNTPNRLFAKRPAVAVVIGKLLAVALAYQLQAVPLRIG